MGQIGADVWTTGRPTELRRIAVAPFAGGWIVSEASLANAQFFHDVMVAQAAAIGLGQRLADVGEPCEVELRLPDGRLGSRFLCVARSGAPSCVRDLIPLASTPERPKSSKAIERESPVALPWAPNGLPAEETAPASASLNLMGASSLSQRTIAK